MKLRTRSRPTRGSVERKAASSRTKDIPTLSAAETIRGRTFNPREIKIISTLVHQYFKHGRTRISVEVCKTLNWKQPNGWLKDRACREVLRIFAEKQYFRLPRAKTKINNVAHYSKILKKPLHRVDTALIDSADLHSLTYRQVKGERDEDLWNWLVNKYHYLGFKLFVGRYLKYLIYAEDRIVAALGLCDPAWAISVRDTALHAIGVGTEEARLRGINNGRFLIMPWVKVDNLASRILSLATSRFVSDWSSYYSVEPILMETFVDPDRFNGTCYKAANWIYLGESRGYFKSGRSHHNSQTPKMLFVYPLRKDVRQLLGSSLKESKRALSDR